jgi:hypothetical protein
LILKKQYLWKDIFSWKIHALKLKGQRRQIRYHYNQQLTLSYPNLDQLISKENIRRRISSSSLVNPVFESQPNVACDYFEYE